MISVYYDSQLLRDEWLNNILRGLTCVPYTNLDEFEADTAEIKLAFTSHRLHCDHDAYTGFEKKIKRLSAVSQLVFSFESELHWYHWEIWENCHRKNVYWCLPGQVNDNSEMAENIIYWGDWMKTTANLYKQLPDVTAKYTPYAVKPRYFDALLGSPKPHRTFVNESVKANGLQDKFVMTYGGQWDDNSFYAKDYFIWEPGTEVVEKDAPGTCGYVKYHNVLCHLSQVIPTDVFNDTAYSIVAETDFDNTLSFYSEKTAKPMIYRRLFVAFSGYKFLHNLHELGFKTFGNVIDESYDLIKDDEQRLAAAFEQVKWLCSQPQDQIYLKIADTLDHNYNLIMSTDWNIRCANQVRALIDHVLIEPKNAV
jgi:hypothetical protein